MSEQQTIREAAERLRRWDAMYIVKEYEDKTHWLAGDRALISKLWLAEHPADDDEPVTSDWLVSIGFKDNRNIDDDPDGSPHLILDSHSIIFWVESSDRKWSIHFTDIKDQTTRGDVRRLIEALKGTT